jgi:hypothetical protein
VTLLLDVVWLWVRIQSWRIPSTKILPSCGNHVASDGLPIAIHILLVAAMITGVLFHPPWPPGWASCPS